MIDNTLPYQKDRAELASEAGFTGTLLGLLDWIDDALTYGAIRRENAVDDFGRDVLRVEMVTGGYSSDEHLLARLRRSPYLVSGWRATHRGGLYLYEFSKSWVENTEPIQWLVPESTEPFETVARARKVRLVTPEGEEISFEYAYGVELYFDEPDRDICEPAGVLTIQPCEPTQWDLPVAAKTEES